MKNNTFLMWYQIYKIIYLKKSSNIHNLITLFLESVFRSQTDPEGQTLSLLFICWVILGKWLQLTEF